MGRKFTRKMKGGDVDIEAVKSTIVQLKDDVSRITADIETLGKNLELNVVPEVFNEEVKIESEQSELQDKAKQVVDEFNQELINYAKLMKELGDNNNAITKDAKEILLENMKTNKELLETEGITEEWLNSLKINDNVQINDNNNVQINDNNVQQYPIKFKDFNFTIGDLKKLIDHKYINNKTVQKYIDAKKGFYTIYNNKKNYNKEDLIQNFENFLNSNSGNLGLFENFNYTKSIKNNTNGWTFGGRKTKKNKRKSRKNNKSRK